MAPSDELLPRVVITFVGALGPAPKMWEVTAERAA